MPPPVATARTAIVDPSQANANNWILNGFRSVITFSGDSGIWLYEIEVTPPGYDGGEAIPQGNMFSSKFDMMTPRGLVRMTDIQATVAYATAVLAPASPAGQGRILPLINVNLTITVSYPNGSTLAFFGFLRSFKPNSNKDGERPTAVIVITPSNMDPTDQSEQLPVYTAAGIGSA